MPRLGLFLPPLTPPPFDGSLPWSELVPYCSCLSAKPGNSRTATKSGTNYVSETTASAKTYTPKERKRSLCGKPRLNCESSRPTGSKDWTFTDVA